MRTPLYDEHRRLGARMTSFAGWEMPVYYSGIADETLAVRSAAGIFDLSHMGELLVSGPAALDSIQYLTTNDASRLDIGQAQYSLMCSGNGGVLDDLIVYRLGKHSYMLVVNAANTDSDACWIMRNKVGETQLKDESRTTASIAVQGPAAAAILSSAVSFDIDSLGRFRVQCGDVRGIRCRIARTGYTGEDGFELYCSWTEAVALWRAIVEVGGRLGARPIGLGARDVLRLEAGYPLYGYELTNSITPVDARLLWVVQFDKGDFLGKQAILTARESGPQKLLIGLEAIGKCVPRHGYNVRAAEDEVGRVTSGTFSPTLGKAIAMAYVCPEYSQTGRELDVVIRGKPCKCRIVPTPFYRPLEAAHPGKPTRRRARSAS